MSKILVTGGAGFIGSHLVDALIKKNHHVVVVDDLSCGRRKNVNKKANFVRLKIQSNKLEQIFRKEKFDFVYHLAAQKDLQVSIKNPILDAETNIIGSLNVLKESKKFNIKKIIFFSSAAVYNSKQNPPNKENDELSPVTAYGISKRTMEDYIINSGMKYTILRPSNVYGPRQDTSGEGGVIALFVSNIISNKPVAINNNGRQTRDFIYVDDLVNAAVTVLKKGDNITLNISTNRETSVKNLIDFLKIICRTNVKVKKGENIDEQFRSALSYMNARKKINWSPKINIRNGLLKTYNWFSENYEKK